MLGSVCGEMNWTYHRAVPFRAVVSKARYGRDAGGEGSGF